jgi:glycosyltransferase involved in cell wall biosynthesis
MPSSPSQQMPTSPADQRHDRFHRRSLRVLVVTPRAHPDVGGVENHVLETTRRLAAAGARVTLLTTDRTGRRPRKEVVDGVLIIRVRAVPKSRDYYFAPDVYRHVRLAEWDVVHCQSYHTLVPPLAMVAARRSRIPYVVSFHSGGHDSSMRRLGRGPQQLALRPLLRDASRLICVSDFERSVFSGILGLPLSRFDVIPNGCDLPDPGQVGPAAGPVIASIGRLERYKGHHRLIGAMPHLLHRLPSVRAVIVGEGPYRAQLNALARRLGVEEAVEFRSIPSHDRLAMARIMRESALVMLLSEYESAGMAVLEAVGLGTPALVLDSTALHDLVDAGWAGAVAADADDAQVADAIAASLARAHASTPPQIPTWDDCARSLLSVYESVAAPAPPMAARPDNVIQPRSIRRNNPYADRRQDALRVLMVTPRNPLEFGGVERHVIEVSRRLVGAGTKVEVLCADARNRVPHQETHDGISIRAVRGWPMGGDYHLAPRIWREMAREPWDLVHVQSYHTLVAPLAMLRALTLGIPYVVTFHGGGHSSRTRHALRRIQRRALRPLLARASRLVAVARFEIELYGGELQLAPERFVLIPNGAEASPVERWESEGRLEHAVLASIGRLERYKGHQRVIAALPHVLARRPDARLMIVGTGPYEPALRQQAAEHKVDHRVEFTSVSPDDRVGMARLLRRVSLVVLLSEFETQPLVALEAAAAGNRLLVSDHAGLRELAQDGLARAVAPDARPAVVGRAILEELADRRPRRAPRLASWDDCASSLLELYDTIVWGKASDHVATAGRT